MSTDDNRCTRCGLPADALGHRLRHGHGHPFEAAGQCADCGHNADAHDEEDGHCLVGLVGFNRCDCVGFEAES